MFVQFIGYKTTQQIKPAKPIEDMPCVVDDQSKEADKQLVKTLSQVIIKANRQKYTAMAND